MFVYVSGETSVKILGKPDFDIAVSLCVKLVTNSEKQTWHILSCTCNSKVFKLDVDNAK